MVSPYIQVQRLNRCSRIHSYNPCTVCSTHRISVKFKKNIQLLRIYCLSYSHLNNISPSTLNSKKIAFDTQGHEVCWSQLITPGWLGNNGKIRVSLIVICCSPYVVGKQ